MIRIRDVYREIVENCFGQEEKDILEFQQGKIQMTVENQLLRYYRTACYPFDKDSLFRDVAFLIEDNRVLLHKIKQAKTLVDQILNPASWDEVTLRVGTAESEGSNIGSSTSKTTSDSIHKEGGTSKGQSDSASIERSQGATSETSELQTLEQVIDKPKINHQLLEEKELILDETEKIWKEMAQSGSQHPTTPLDPVPQLHIEESKIDPLYQHVTTGITNSEDTASSYSESTGKSVDKDNSTTDGASSSLHKNKSQRGDMTRKFKLGEQSIQALNAEITALRSKFWHKFYSIFTYVRNY